ncbi:MAG: Hpt domain-containing protein [Myxococcaceae bacterium]|nr:Hpt domain-containing protein [Myxococcaceae bacterium]
MPPSRILLVEDVQLHKALALELLSARGHSVTVAGSAGDALGLLARERFDAVLVDLHLPDGGGEAVLEGLNGSLPVVAFSAHEEPEAQLKARGFAGRVLKPLDAQRFAQQVEAFLPGHGRLGGLRAEAEAEAEAEADALGPLLEDLLERFARTLPGQVETLSTLLADARANPKDADRQQRLRALAHQLRGTCGSYGYDAVGAACAQMEDVLEAFGAHPSAKMWEALEGMLADARAGLAARPST